jgi:hypothetical protein
MSLSLQPGLNESSSHKLQRKQRKRNCEIGKKNLEVIVENTYLCNPNRKDGKRREKERIREEQNTTQIDTISEVGQR